MSAWETCRVLERTSREHLRQHLLPVMAFEGRYVHIDKGAMAQAFQMTQGDYVINSDNDTAWRVEHKCEAANTFGNFFIETFSNLSRGNPGWFWKLDADFLMYHFLREGEVYLLGLPALRTWLYSSDQRWPRAHSYKHARQRKHDQKNDTWGYCVNIKDVMNGMNVSLRHVPELLFPISDEAA